MRVLYFIFLLNFTFGQNRIQFSNLDTCFIITNEIENYFSLSDGTRYKIENITRVLFANDNFITLKNVLGTKQLGDNRTYFNIFFKNGNFEGFEIDDKITYSSFYLGNLLYQFQEKKGNFMINNIKIDIPSKSKIMGSQFFENNLFLCLYDSDIYHDNKSSKLFLKIVNLINKQSKQVIIKPWYSYEYFTELFYFDMYQLNFEKLNFYSLNLESKIFYKSSNNNLDIYYFESIDKILVKLEEDLEITLKFNFRNLIDGYPISTYSDNEKLYIFVYEKNRVYILKYKYLENLAKIRINAVYARRGKVFKSKYLQEIFNNLNWYKPNINFKDSMLSIEDKDKINRILLENSNK